MGHLKKDASMNQVSLALIRSVLAFKLPRVARLCPLIMMTMMMADMEKETFILYYKRKQKKRNITLAFPKGLSWMFSWSPKRFHAGMS